MKFRLKSTNQFDKQLKKCLKRGYNESELENVLGYILNGEKLPAKYKQHKTFIKIQFLLGMSYHSGLVTSMGRG